MFHINRIFITLAMFCLLALAVSATAAQESALVDRPLAANVQLHLIPENAPVEIWRMNGDQIVEGWLSISAWQRRTSVVVTAPANRADVTVHVIPFTDYVSIWRTEGNRIIEGWVSAPAQ